MSPSLLSTLLITSLFLLNIGFSNGYLYTRLCRPSTLLVRSVFVLTFGLSASLLQLCLWEINGSLDSDARELAWKCVVRALLADLIVVIPLLASYVVLEKVASHLSRGYRVLLPLGPYLGLLYLFYQLGAVLPLPEKKGYFWRTESRSLTEECVLRVGAMGVTLMAMLSGFGSVCAGWETYLTPNRYSPVVQVFVSEADVVRARMSVQMTQDLIAEKRRKIEQLEGRIHEKSQESSSFMNRVVNTVRGSSEQQELHALQTELTGLSQMHSSLQSHQTSLQTMYTRQSTRNTPFGILAYFTRHLFALYCIYRILSTTYTLLRSLTSTTQVSNTEDPVSRFLALLASYLSPSDLETLDIEGYRHLTGFILVGIIIAGSVNAVINTVQRMSKRTPLSPSISTLCVSWTSGIYFVSTALMLRGSLPEKYSGGIVNALGTRLARGVFERWFDVVFFLSVGLTGVGLFVARSWGEEDIEVEGKEV